MSLATGRNVRGRASTGAGLLLLVARPCLAQASVDPQATSVFLATYQLVASEWLKLVGRFSVTWESGELLRSLTLLIVVLMTAAGAEILYWCYAAPALRSLEAQAAMTIPRPPRWSLFAGLQRLALRLFGIALSTGAAIGATLVLPSLESVTTTASLAAAALAGARIARAMSDFVLAPRLPALRLWPSSDGEATRIHREVVGLACIAGLGFLANGLFATVLESPELARFASDVAAILIALVLFRVIAAWSRRRRASPRPRRSLADLLPFGAVTATICALALWFVGSYQAVSTIAIMAILALADVTAGGVLHKIVKQRSPVEDGAQPQPSVAAAYEPVTRRVIRFGLVSVGVVAILAVWRINLLMQAAAGRPYATIIAQSVNVVVVILLCDLAWLWVKTFIARQLGAPSSLAEVEKASRLATLLPMIRTAILIVLLGLTTLVVLSAIGVNIAPLLAGAGVVGLAIGFGAQTLVRDVITGVFFLIEDAFRVGEYIDVGTRKGTVEAISLRSLRLRHQRGALHTIPFGEIKSLSNESRDWSIVKLEFRIPFDTDLKLVKKIIKTINAEIAADPELGPHLLDPLKSQGINRFEEYWMVMRAKFTARPNSYQFMIRREAYHRIRDAFDQAGIRLGERSVKVEVAGGSQADLAAAGRAADELDEERSAASS
jgi:small-conductance mechanosensitive channel